MKRRLLNTCPRRFDTNGWRGSASLDAPIGEYVQYLAACVGTQSVEVMSRSLDEGNCARHHRSHGPGNA
eukprot:6074311-Lingulodinium_polyedra.AAC.1